MTIPTARDATTSHAAGGLSTSHHEIFAPVADEIRLVVDNIRGLAAGSRAQSPSVAQRLRHLLSTPGKRVRPGITLLASRLFEGCDSDAPVIMATAVELLHIASLIHDDTVDSADIRRGQATASNLWGRDVAVLLGDYVFATSATFVCDTNNIYLIRRFAETIVELSRGELTEMLEAGDPEAARSSYLQRIYDKTASLFCTASESGAILGGASEDDASRLRDYGYNIGMAYQVKDDVLDFEATSQSLGKPVARDLASGVVTMPSIILMERDPGNNPVSDFLSADESDRSDLLAKAVEAIRESGALDDARAVAFEYLNAARKSLATLEESSEKRSLLALADFTSRRSH